MPRPKDKTPRVRLTAYILPKTDHAIRAETKKKFPKKQTLGKVIDRKFQK